MLLRDVGKVVVTSDVKFNETLFPWRGDVTAHVGSDHVLVLFHGPRATDESLKSNLEARGATATAVDNDAELAGGCAEDLLNDACFNDTLG